MDKKAVIQTLILAIIILAIPLSVRLAQTQQQLKSKAAGEGIVPVEGDTLKCSGSGAQQVCTTTKAAVEIKLDSPFGSPAPVGVGTTGAP